MNEQNAFSHIPIIILNALTISLYTIYVCNCRYCDDYTVAYVLPCKTEPFLCSRHFYMGLCTMYIADRIVCYAHNTLGVFITSFNECGCGGRSFFSKSVLKINRLRVRQSVLHANGGFDGPKILAWIRNMLHLNE